MRNLKLFNTNVTNLRKWNSSGGIVVASQKSRQYTKVTSSEGIHHNKRPTKVNLVLQNGQTFPGYSFGAPQSKPGEIVFTTGMVGYPEALTDPSYSGQLLAFTYPLIGNYGVPDTSAKDKFGLLKHVESNKIHAQAVICQNYTSEWSHWNGVKSLGEWLKEEGVPGVYGIDTRALTKVIRGSGSGCLAKLEFEGESKSGNNDGFVDPNLRNLIQDVSRKEIQTYGLGNPLKITCVDCGVKENIIRNLVKRGAEVRVVPYNYDFTRDKYDGLFISNGPGNPAYALETVRHIKYHLDHREESVFGICLGNQLIGQAAGAGTYKLPFGNRGHNQPCVNLINGRAYITSQNHGYALDESTLPSYLKPLFMNANDMTNEGLIHTTKPIFTCQFHPEAFGGPLDSEFLFDAFFKIIRENHKTAHAVLAQLDQNKTCVSTSIPKSCLILGSGGLSIGQAGEFDYSGSQAIKALKEEHVRTILINPNIASVQTNIPKVSLSNKNDDSVLKSADQVYFLPVNVDYVEEIIRRERPESILLSMGGQTALNVGVELWKRGVFEKYGVRVLGTPIEVVINTEDRRLFKDRLNEIGEKLAESCEAYSTIEALAAADRIKYPVMIRVAYALGGLGSGICKNPNEVTDLCSKAFAVAPQVLVERCLTGWKEVEYEVVRDFTGNCITVCNMENLDPLGVHTGDSIVVAPSQTLSNEEYHMLRRTSINVINHLGIIGECNIQYALNPNSLEYYIIEVNARLSRSSALASKATSYPLAFIAAKLSLGLKLTDIKNQATKHTTACFEPSMDYIVTKIPRWDLDRFEFSNNRIDSSMKSVGEVMAIARSFEESFQKALRATHSSVAGFTDQLPMNKPYETDFNLEQNMAIPNTNRIYVIARALNEGWSVDKIHECTKIDKWFLNKMQTICKFVKDNRKGNVNDWGNEMMRNAKELGFSDRQIGQMGNVVCSEDDVRKVRLNMGIRPVVKQIDTTAAEYPVFTNYLYCTYSGTENDVIGSNGTLVLGCGAYHIGSSVEFDWCAVSAIRTMKKCGQNVVMINHNPETISTDFDEAHKLYFEELSTERVLDIYEHEQAKGVIVSMSGQLPNNLALPLYKQNCNILGTNPYMIDKCEDRTQFSAVLDTLNIKQAAWHSVTSIESAREFCKSVGYPCLLRPSYVLSGSAMHVVNNEEELGRYLGSTVRISGECPVVVTKFIEGASEVEMDAVGKDGKVMVSVMSEHLEKAGVHSGDATLILPTQNISHNAIKTIKKISKKIAKHFQITGPFNLQFLVTGDQVLVIECNLRASRSVPFISKTVGVDLINIATKFIINHPLNERKLRELERISELPSTFIGVKVPMFSWPRLRGADPILKCIMSSTGEVASYGKSVEEAYLKAVMSTGIKVPRRGVLVNAQAESMEGVSKTMGLFRDMGLKIWAGKGTREWLGKVGIDSESVDNVGEGEKTALKLIRDGNVDLVINITDKLPHEHQENYLIRRTAVDFNINCITNLQNAMMFSKALSKYERLNAETLVHYQEEQAELMNEDKKQFNSGN